MYRYAANNPIRYTDPDGEFLHLAAGTFVGALVGGVSSYFSQKISGQEVDWTKVGLAAFAGGASGLLAASGVGIVGQVLINGGISATQNILEQHIDMNKATTADENMSFSVEDVFVCFVIGGISGFAGGRGAETPALKSMQNRMIKRIENALLHNNYSDIGKALAYYAKVSKTQVNTATFDTIMSVLKSYIPDGVILSKRVYENIKANFDMEMNNDRQ